MPPIHVRKTASSAPVRADVVPAVPEAVTSPRSSLQLTSIPLRVVQRVSPMSAAPVAGVVQLWHAVRGQEGEFEGDENAHHLHRVGGEEHYRYGSGERVNYIRVGVRTKYEHVARAIEVCEAAGPSDSGRAECLAYLRELLSTLERPAPIVRPEEKKEPPKKDPPPKKPLGKKAQALEDRWSKRQDDPFGF